MSSPEKPPDANPVFQSMLEAGRAFWVDAKKGQQMPISCSLLLLERSEPEGAQMPAEERVRAWAEKQKFEVSVSQADPGEPKYAPNGKKITIMPPKILTVTITR